MEKNSQKRETLKKCPNVRIQNIVATVSFSLFIHSVVKTRYCTDPCIWLSRIHLHTCMVI
jgi:hypothetical protein